MSGKRYIDEPPAGLEGWRRVWSDDLQFPSAEDSSLRSRFVRAIFGPLIRKVLLASDGRQRDFNLATLELLDDIRKDVTALREDVRKDVDDLRRDIAGFDDKVLTGVRRNDALVAALDQKIETVAARLRDVTLPVLRDPDARRFREDFVYRRLEDGLRGSGEEIRKSLEPYIAWGGKMPPVIDVGCGRGEFLEMCRESQIPAKGFDTNERSVADLRSRGFDVSLGSLPGCLDDLGAGSAGSILASHVVEHLPTELLVATFASAHRALGPGGYLMIETPNAQSISMSAAEFWRDPTHLAPRHVGALTLIGRETGFEVAEVATVAPFPEANLIDASAASGEVQAIVARINEILFGDQNLRLVLRKK